MSINNLFGSRFRSRSRPPTPFVSPPVNLVGTRTFPSFDLLVEKRHQSSAMMFMTCSSRPATGTLLALGVLYFFPPAQAANAVCKGGWGWVRTLSIKSSQLVHS